MLTTPKALLAFWLLIAIVNSTPRPSAQNFDSNSDAEPPVNTSLDGLSYNDDSMASAALTNTFGSDLTADSNPIGDQENLFAGNIRAGDSCRAEDAQSVSAIGRLRRREGSQSVPGEGKTCVSPAAGASNEPLDPFLLQLPQVEEVVAPAVVGRLDICPPLVFGDRDIPLCSLAPPQELINKGVSTLVVINAVVYNPFYGCLVPEQLWCCNSVSLIEPGWNDGEVFGWGMTGFDCMENGGLGTTIPK